MLRNKQKGAEKGREVYENNIASGKIPVTNPIQALAFYRTVQKKEEKNEQPP